MADPAIVAEMDQARAQIRDWIRRSDAAIRAGAEASTRVGSEIGDEIFEMSSDQRDALLVAAIDVAHSLSIRAGVFPPLSPST